MSLTEEIWTVQSYIEGFIDGCPNHLRPMMCPHCQAEVMLHKHGSFKRTVYTLLEVFIISIFRFKCTKCGRSTSLLPNFVMEHHQVAWEVKEEVIHQQLSGIALLKIAEDLVTSAGKFSEKTLWRWSKAIRDELKDSSSEQWQIILEKLPHVEIPVGPSKPVREWAWLFTAWEQVRSTKPGYMNIGLLARLYQIKRSRAVTVG
ncbi:DUF6431 domain-containing protein [Desulfosporosinus metallidurans]|nr:DUF6431 domain-containing protein [Desulfosporosinus metallidurans]